MTEKHRIGQNFITDTGDVRSMHDYYDDFKDSEPSQDAELIGYAQRIATARKYAVSKIEAVPSDEIFETSKNIGIHIPREVLDLLIDAAHHEDELRSKGYKQQRIGEKVGKPLTIKMLHLQLNGIDTSNAFGSSQLDTDDNVSDIEKLRMDKIDKLVDQGMSYDDARRRA
jgi:hypothetical protein